MFGSRPRLAIRIACIALVAGALFATSASPALGRVFLQDEEGYVPPPNSGGSIVLKGSATAWTSRASSLTVPHPGGAEGDVLIGVVTARLSAGGSVTPPLGWSLVRRDSNIGGAALSQALYLRVLTAFEPSSYTWRFSSAVGATAGITVFGGVSASSPVEANGGLYRANTRLIAAPSLTTTLDGSVVLGWYGNSAKTSMAPPSGMTESFDVTSAAQQSDASTSESASVYQMNRGPTGYRVATSGAKAKSAIGQSL